MGKYSLSGIIHKLKYKDYINKDEFSKLQQAQKAYNALPKIISRIQDLVNENFDYDEYHNGKDIAYQEVLGIIQEEAGDLVCNNRSPEEELKESFEAEDKEWGTMEERLGIKESEEE